MNLVSKIVAVVVAIATIIFFWQRSDAVVVDNQYHFSHNDIAKLYDIEQQLGDIIGTSVVESETDVLYNLVIAAAQKSILGNSGIKVEQDNAIAFVEQNNQVFKGFYEKAKQQMGLESYYRLLIEPIAISEAFLRFYNAVEPAKQRGEAVLKAAKIRGLSAVAAELKQDVVDVNIAKNNTALLQEFSKFKKEGVFDVIYPKTIKIAGNIAVLNLNFKKEEVDITALVFKIVPYRQFITQLLANVDIAFPMFSRYAMGDIYNEKGSLLQ